MPTSSELLSLGALKVRCAEAVEGLKCAECGNTSHGAVDWKNNGGACPICGSTSPRHICVRCGGGFDEPLPRREHPCRSVGEFERSGHVAFAEAVSSLALGTVPFSGGVPKEAHHRRSPAPKARHTTAVSHAHPVPPKPASPPDWTFLTRLLALHDLGFLQTSAKYSLIAAVVFLSERILFGAWFSPDGGPILTSSSRYGMSLSLVASAVFLFSVWFFLPFKQATLVAVLVALVIEAMFGIAGQCIVNIDWLLATQREVDRVTGIGMAWGICGGILCFAMRYAAKVANENHIVLSFGLVLCAIWLISTLI